MSAHRFPRTRLSLMMFFEFLVWGLWFPTLGLVMTRHGLGGAIGDAFSAGPLASILSPIVLGLVVDRFIASQRAMAILHFLGAALLWMVPKAIDTGDSHGLIVLLLTYMLCYMPTLALANNVAFHTLGDERGDFPFVRVFGTIGWVCAGLGVGQGGFSDDPRIFDMASLFSVVLGIYCFFLPGTPPPLSGRPLSLRDLLFIDAFRLLRERNFGVFGLCAALIAAPLATYYAYASPFLGAAQFDNVGTIMALGQISETGFMLLIPLCLRRLGVKYTLLLGMTVMAIRYVMFSAGIFGSLRPLIVLGVALHGVCYDFFFVVAFMYADQVAGANIKGQSQGLVVMLTYGLGLLLGSQLSGLLYAALIHPAATSFDGWTRFWLWPSAFAAAVAAVFWILFRPDARAANSPPQR